MGELYLDVSRIEEFVLYQPGRRKRVKVEVNSRTAPQGATRLNQTKVGPLRLGALFN